MSQMQRDALDQLLEDRGFARKALGMELVPAQRDQTQRRSRIGDRRHGEAHPAAPDGQHDPAQPRTDDARGALEPMKLCCGGRGTQITQQRVDAFRTACVLGRKRAQELPQKHCVSAEPVAGAGHIEARKR